MATQGLHRAAQSRMRQQIIRWLSDAHAMEMQAIQILENQARRIESYPDLRGRILEHLEETRGQIENGRVAHYQVVIKVGFTLDD